MDGRIDVRWHGRDDAERNAAQVKGLLTRYPDGRIPSDESRDV
jgi:hypothetical protein